MDSANRFGPIHIIIQLQMGWRIEWRYLECPNTDILNNYYLQDTVMTKSTQAPIMRAIPRSMSRRPDRTYLAEQANWNFHEFQWFPLFWRALGSIWQMPFNRSSEQVVRREVSSQNPPSTPESACEPPITRTHILEPPDTNWNTLNHPRVSGSHIYAQRL